MSREVWSWPEASLYVFTGGESPAALAFCEDVQIAVQWRWLRRPTLATGADFVSRTRRTLEDKRVDISIGMMHYTGALFQRAQSATAYNFAFSASSYIDGAWQSAARSVWSAVFRQFVDIGRQGDIWRARVSIEADDISGY